VKLKRMKTHIRGALATGGSLRLWTGVPVGLAVSYAAGKLMPDFPSITNPYLTVAPYYAPATALGVLALLSPKTRRAGYGILGAVAGFYFWSIFPVITGQKQMPDSPSDTVDNATSSTSSADSSPGTQQGAAVQIL